MANFKYPLLLKGIEEKHIRELIPELEKLGYFSRRFNYNKNYNFVTNYMNENGRLQSVNKGEGKYYRTTITEYNKDLILALAACRNSDNFNTGEWLFCIKSPYSHIKEGDLGMITSTENNNLNTTYNYSANEKAYFGVGEVNKWFRKATKEEIMDYFNGTKSVVQSYNINEWYVKTNMIEAPVVAKYINEKLGKNEYGGNGSGYYFNESTKKHQAGDSDVIPTKTATILTYQQWEDRILNKKVIINNQKPIENGNAQQKQQDSIIKVCRLTPTITIGERLSRSTVQGRRNKVRLAESTLSFKEITQN